MLASFFFYDGRLLVGLLITEFMSSRRSLKISLLPHQQEEHFIYSVLFLFSLHYHNNNNKTINCANKSLGAHMRAHTSAHLGLGVQTSSHMRSHISLGAHTSAYLSKGAHRSAHMCAFLPRVHLCPCWMPDILQDSQIIGQSDWGVTRLGLSHYWQNWRKFNMEKHSTTDH